MLELMKRPKARSPFRGKPTTCDLHHRDGSLRGYRVTAEYLTPLRAKIADYSAKGLVAAAMAAGFIAATHEQPNNDALLLGSLIIPPLSYPLARFLLRSELRKSTTCEITADTFRINGMLGWKTYDRNLPHRFAILEHDKAQRERDAHELADRKAMQKGKVLKQTKYYQEGWHVVFEYTLQRIDIADVYGLKDARAIQARLAGCAQVMDALAGNGNGPAMIPAHQWSDAPGDIPA